MLIRNNQSALKTCHTGISGPYPQKGGRTFLSLLKGKKCQSFQPVGEGEVWTFTERFLVRIIKRQERQPSVEEFRGWFFSGVTNPLTRIRASHSELADSTIKIWGRRLKRSISDEEAEEIIRSYKGFLSLLKEG
jgi:hypothetical protein